MIEVIFKSSYYARGIFCVTLIRFGKDRIYTNNIITRNIFILYIAHSNLSTAMNELQELREKIEKQDYQGALLIVNELEEMSVDDKLNKIYSYVVILLVHLIKQEAENRTTSSWNRSIYNSIKYINKTNKRRRSGGYYASNDMLQEIIDEAYDHALTEASFEAFEGELNAKELAEKINSERIKQDAIAQIKHTI